VHALRFSAVVLELVDCIVEARRFREHRAILPQRAALPDGSLGSLDAATGRGL
jgi:hypothetical protein